MVAAPRSVVNAGRSAGHGAIQDRPCRIPASRTRRRGRRCHAGPDDDESEVDIDELAERLMREAASSAGINSDSNAGAGPAQPTTWQGVLDTFDAGRLGEFYPEEFELLKEQGRLGSAGGDPVLIAYAGRFYSGMPFEDPVLVSLREFVPNEQDEMLGVRELIVLSHLCNGFPPRDRRWKVASAYPDRKTDPLVMTLLGYFVAGTTLPGSSQNSIWIVQQWDGFAPLEGYSVAQQTSGFGLGRLFGAETRAVNDREQMIRAITRGMLEAVAFLHDASVAHGALSMAVFRLSTFDDKEWQRVQVKVDGLGVATYGRRMPAALTSIFSGDFLERCRMDRQRLGLLIIELVVTSLSTPPTASTGSAPSMDLARLERVLTDVYGNDLEQFTAYLVEESAYDAAVEYMGASGVAEVVEVLLEGRMELTNVLCHSYFDE